MRADALKVGRRRLLCLSGKQNGSDEAIHVAGRQHSTTHTFRLPSDFMIQDG